MFPYWLLLGFFSAMALVTPPDMRAEKKTAFLITALAILTVMIGLRVWVGVDYANYLKAWNPADRMTLGKFLDFRPGDPVFYSMLWGLRNIGWPYWTFNLICGAVFSVGLVQFARRQPNSWLAVAVAVPYLVIVIAMSATRQATAIGFVFLGLVAFQRGNTRSFLAWIMVAALMHASAIIVLPFAGLTLAKNKFQSVALLLITAIAGYFLLGATLGDYTRDYLGNYVSSSGGTAYRIAMNLVPAVFYLMLSRRLPFTDRQRTLWRNFAFLAIASVPLLFVIQSSTALDRLLLYAFPLQIMMLAWLPYLFRQKIQQLIVVFAILLYLALQQFVFLNYATHAHRFIPYRNVLFGG
jgi:hypothetical protein